LIEVAWPSLPESALNEVAWPSLPESASLD
jgi:hypothetical protein